MSDFQHAYERKGTVWVRGTVEGKHYRVSAKIPATQKNLRSCDKKWQTIIENHLSKKEKPAYSECATTFKEFAMQALEATAHNRTEHTQKEYLGTVNNYLIPEFGNYPLDKIKAIDVERFQSKLSKKSKYTAKRARKTLSYILNQAFINDLVSQNAVKKVTPIRIEKRIRHQAYSLQDVQKVLNDPSPEWINYFLAVGFLTGMRTGEIMALKWDDIDFESETILVRRSINHGTVRENTKTHAHRRIDMLPLLKEKLLEYKEISFFEWLFVSKDAKPFYESKNIVKYHVLPLFERLNIEFQSLYSTRHSFASILLNDGMDVAYIQRNLGHANAHTTLSYYTQYLENKDTRTAKAQAVFEREA